MTWYRKAAEQGHAKAQYALGSMYRHGHGVPQYYAEAITWFRKAAEQGNVHAQNDLGVMYADSEGVPRDPVRAYMWSHLAASQGYTSAVANRDALADSMTSEQISKAEALAQEWASENR